MLRQESLRLRPSLRHDEEVAPTDAALGKRHGKRLLVLISDRRVHESIAKPQGGLERLL